MSHDYSIHPVVGGRYGLLAGYRVECSCGFTDLVPWVGSVEDGRHIGETTRECREHAATIALKHARSKLELSTRSNYRTRQFVPSTEGMDEMFPGAK